MKIINNYIKYLEFVKTNNHMFGLDKNDCVSYEKEYRGYLYRICITDYLIYFKEENNDKSGSLRMYVIDKHNDLIIKYFYNKFSILLRKRKLEKLLS